MDRPRNVGSLLSARLLAVNLLPIPESRILKSWVPKSRAAKDRASKDRVFKNRLPKTGLPKTGLSKTGFLRTCFWKAVSSEGRQKKKRPPLQNGPAWQDSLLKAQFLVATQSSLFLIHGHHRSFVQKKD